MEIFHDVDPGTKCVAFKSNTEMAHPHVLTDDNAERCENDALVRVIKPSGLEQFLCDRHLAREMPTRQFYELMMIDVPCSFCGATPGVICWTPKGNKVEPNMFGVRCHDARMKEYGRRGIQRLTDKVEEDLE